MAGGPPGRAGRGSDPELTAPALTALGDDPYREDADVEKLAGPSGLYRLRVGGYRIAYQVDEGGLVVLVVKVGSRRDVYRNP
ncbi:type II toxin-antitoxin system RelE family toxin [Streptomyces sp. enrichment culture]|uniref:type II toxin-antitoxin system RelE family toxin n=1 Tax=Streptomyces sp. enrichment culture TaxID=1795815 RepID=UPI003F5501EF